MRAVRLTHARWVNERVHGDDGAVLFLDDEEAADVVASGAAVYDTRYSPPPAPAPPAVKDEDTLRFAGEAERAAADKLVQLTEDLGLYDPVAVIKEDLADMPLPGAEPEAEPLTKPWTIHSKAKWVEWAIHCGANPGLAAAMTKNELMGRYGERL
jgi:hypothetical protein